MKILVVEDDKKIASFLQKGLSEELYNVEISYDGAEALYLVEVNTYDLILLDIMLPSLSGIEVCKQIRTRGIKTPIIMLTAKDTISDKVDTLSIGADDYITKPFAFEELIARVKVQLRKKGSFSSNILSMGLLCLDIDSKKVSYGSDNIALTNKEYLLLKYLLLNKNKIVTEDMILNSLWPLSDIASNNISVFIYRLRSKIDKKFGSKLLKTIRGIGYKLSEN